MPFALNIERGCCPKPALQQKPPLTTIAYALPDCCPPVSPPSMGLGDMEKVFRRTKIAMQV